MPWWGTKIRDIEKMRKAITLFLVLYLLVIAGCDTERIIFKGPYFVRFTESSITKKESYSKPVSIEIHQAGPALDEDITITYEISGNAREGIDYRILGDRGNIVIKKGEYVGDIQIQLINNANNILRTQDIIFTLNVVSTDKRKIGQGESAIGKSFTFTINDDCILGGAYIGHNGSPPVEGIEITSTDCETYTLSNWNVNIFSVTTAMTLKFVDNGDNTLTIPEQESAGLPSDLATISGTGVVDPLTRNIIMTVTLVDFTGSPQVDFTLTPD